VVWILDEAVICTRVAQRYLSFVLGTPFPPIKALDLVCQNAKLFALCDRGIDIGDCIALAPTATVLPWLELQDANPDWPAHVRVTLTDLGKEAGSCLLAEH
jgi:hypothetical protein